MQKVLFTYGMKSDFFLILTDAPKEELARFCRRYNWGTENGINTGLDSLKTNFYVKLLADSEVDKMEVCDSIGYDTHYDIGEYRSPDISAEIEAAIREALSSVVKVYIPNTTFTIPLEAHDLIKQKVVKAASLLNDITNYAKLCILAENNEFPENITSSLEKEGCCHPESESGPADYEAMQREADKDSFC